MQLPLDISCNYYDWIFHTGDVEEFGFREICDGAGFVAPDGGAIRWSGSSTSLAGEDDGLVMVPGGAPAEGQPPPPRTGQEGGDAGPLGSLFVGGQRPSGGNQGEEERTGERVHGRGDGTRAGTDNPEGEARCQEGEGGPQEQMRRGMSGRGETFSGEEQSTDRAESPTGCSEAVKAGDELQQQSGGGTAAGAQQVQRQLASSWRRGLAAARAAVSSKSVAPAEEGAGGGAQGAGGRGGPSLAADGGLEDSGNVGGARPGLDAGPSVRRWVRGGWAGGDGRKKGHMSWPCTLTMMLMTQLTVQS